MIKFLRWAFYGPLSCGVRPHLHRPTEGYRIPPWRTLRAGGPNAYAVSSGGFNGTPPPYCPKLLEFIFVTRSMRSGEKLNTRGDWLVLDDNWYEGDGQFLIWNTSPPSDPPGSPVGRSRRWACLTLFSLIFVNEVKHVKAAYAAALFFWTTIITMTKEVANSATPIGSSNGGLTPEASIHPLDDPMVAFFWTVLYLERQPGAEAREALASEEVWRGRAARV